MSTTALYKSTIYDFGHIDSFNHHHNSSSTITKRSPISSSSSSSSSSSESFRNSNSSTATTTSHLHQNDSSLSPTAINHQQQQQLVSTPSTGDNTIIVSPNSKTSHLAGHHNHHHTHNNIKPERLTGLFFNSQNNKPTAYATNSTSVVATNHNNTTTTTITLPKMSGGIRRTVSSSAAAQTNHSSSNSGRSNTTNNQPQTATMTTSSKVNTQSLNNTNKNINGGHHHNNHKSLSDPHKKLDRSYSEPAEKKQLSQQQQGQNVSSLQTSSRYKTELCRSFAEVGHCKYGDKCQFAHGDEELRTITRHPKFKTENCKSFHSTGFCPYGPRCHFIHNSDESKKNLLNMPVGSNPRLFETNPLPISNLIGAVNHHANNHQHQSLVASQSSNLPMIQNHLTFGSRNTTNLIRPKALSLASHSLGSSGEISSPSSQSGSPTSLNSFFTEHTEESALGYGFGASNSRMSANFSTGISSAFSFSPDSAFVAFNPQNQQNNCTNTNNSNNIVFTSGNGDSCHQQKTFMGYGAASTSLNSDFSSPEPSIPGSVISQVLDSGFSSPPLPFESNVFDDVMASTLCNEKLIMGGQQQQTTSFYPTSPNSPVDSDASEIEALKLGDQPTTSISFSSISSSFSASPLSTTSLTSSPPNSGCIVGHQIDLDSFNFLSKPANVVNGTITPNHHCTPIGSGTTGAATIPQRLPTFTKIVATNQNVASPHPIGSNNISSTNQRIIESN